MKLVTCVAALALVSWPVGAADNNNGDCAQLSAAARSRVLRVAARQLRTEPAIPVIDKEAFVDATCYRRLFLSVPGTSRRLTLYLSPDRRFLLSGLWDVSVGPEVADAEVATRLRHEADVERAPARGVTTAPVDVVVFSDFQCPYCAALSTVVKQYQEEKPDTVRVIFRNYPLPGHDWAAAAARAGICVARQDSASFWRFHGMLFSRQKSLSPELLPDAINEFIVTSPELHADEYANCMASSYPEERLRQDIAEARFNDVHGTPTAFINGRRYAGFRDPAGFVTAVGLALQQVTKGETGQ